MINMNLKCRMDSALAIGVKLEYSQRCRKVKGQEKITRTLKTGVTSDFHFAPVMMSKDGVFVPVKSLEGVIWRKHGIKNTLYTLLSHINYMVRYKEDVDVKTGTKNYELCFYLPTLFDSSKQELQFTQVSVPSAFKNNLISEASEYLNTLIKQRDGV